MYLGRKPTHSLQWDSSDSICIRRWIISAYAHITCLIVNENTPETLYTTNTTFIALLAKSQYHFIGKWKYWAVSKPMDVKLWLPHNIVEKRRSITMQSLKDIAYRKRIFVYIENPDTRQIYLKNFMIVPSVSNAPTCKAIWERTYSGSDYKCITDPRAKYLNTMDLK